MRSPKRSTQHEYVEEGPMVKPPLLPADRDTLRAYYITASGRRACMAYDDTVDRCRWCLAIGRTVAPEGTRDWCFCSVECRDGWAEYVRLVLKKLA